MITFSFINLKGGVGKTTVSVNTAYILSEIYGRKVLFIDNDKQGNSSRFFAAEQESTIAQLLLGEKSVHEVIQKTKYKNLDIISADMSLMGANFAIMQDQMCQQDCILKDSLALIQEDYDFCIIDNPPDINLSVLNALVITNEVIVVTTPDEDAMQGVDAMVKQIEDASRYNTDLIFRGCLMNKFVSSNGSYLYKDKSKYPFFNTNIRFVTKVTTDRLIQALKEKVSIFELSANCTIARDLSKFVNELLYM